MPMIFVQYFFRKIKRGEMSWRNAVDEYRDRRYESFFSEKLKYLVLGVYTSITAFWHRIAPKLSCSSGFSKSHAACASISTTQVISLYPNQTNTRIRMRYLFTTIVPFHMLEETKSFILKQLKILSPIFNQSYCRRNCASPRDRASIDYSFILYSSIFYIIF